MRPLAFDDGGRDLALRRLGLPTLRAGAFLASIPFGGLPLTKEHRPQVARSTTGFDTSDPFGHKPDRSMKVADELTRMLEFGIRRAQRRRSPWQGDLAPLLILCAMAWLASYERYIFKY